MISLAQASWDTDCVDSWISSIEEAAGLFEGVFDRILSLLSNNPPHGRYSAKFLFALGKSIPGDDYAAHRGHANLLGEVLGKRTSSFITETTPKKFDMPDGVVTLLSP